MTKYTQADNLSSYNIRKIEQDKHGFVWIATQDGLNRFDGNHFEVFRKNAADNKALLGVDIRDIIIDSASNLVWVLSGEGGLNAIDNITGNIVRTEALRSADAEDWNISMTMRDSLIWIGSFKGVKTYNTRQNKLELVQNLVEGAKKSDEPFEVRHIFTDSYGNVWACITDYGIVIINSLTKTIIRRIEASQITGSGFKCFGSNKTDKGSVLLATSAGLRKIVYDGEYNCQVDTAPCKTLPQINSILTYSVNSNSSGEILISNARNVYVFDKNLSAYTSLKQIRKIGETDWFNSVFCTYSDKNNNVWLGCSEGVGFLRHTPEAFTPYAYDERTNRKLEHVHSIYPMKDGQVLAGLKNGLMLIGHNRSVFYPVDTSKLYHHIYEDPNKVVHAVHTGGMLIYQQKRVYPVTDLYPELRPVAKFPINSHLVLGDSLIILGTENDKGIIVWNLPKKTVKTIDVTTKPAGLAANIVNALYKDKNENIWVLSDKAITIINKDFTASKILQYVDSNSKRPMNIYFDMCEAKGYYWVATYGTGLVQIDSTYKIVNVFNSKVGLSNDGVYKIFCHDGKRMIITSNNGVSVFDAEKLSFSNFYEHDGLHSNAFEEASGYERDGIIYAGGVNGFTAINPGNFIYNTEPPVLYVNHLEIATESGSYDTSNLFLKNISIPNNALQSTIYFSALSFLNPARTTYSYKITELHKEWVNNGTRNFIDLIGLNPGTYTLQIRASNENGVWSDPIQLTLIFLPKWYQTWWFKVLIALTAAAIAYSFYRMRIIQLKKEEQIRKRIAGDLHDDLGSTLNSIKVYTNLALMKPGNAGYLEQLKAGVQNAIIGVRDLVWVLDDKQDTIRNLVERTEQFTGPLASANEIQFEKVVDAAVQDTVLGKEEKRNLYLIIKESVNNSIKYANPSTISLKIGYSERNKFRIVIADNGKGFDLDSIKKGNGLENISLRANQIGYDLNIDSAAGNGTSIILTKA